MTDSRCHRCDRMLPAGHSRYVVAIRVTEDVDVELPRDDDPEPELPRLLEALESSDDLEPNSELAFTICARCRGKWIDNPLGISGAPRPIHTWLH